MSWHSGSSPASICFAALPTRVFCSGSRSRFWSGTRLPITFAKACPRLRPISTVMTVAIAVAIVASAIAFSARTGHALDATRQLLVAGAIMLIAALILLNMRIQRSRLTAAALVALLGIIELLWWNTASRLNAQSRSNYAVLEAPEGPEANAIAVLEEAIAADHRRGERPRIEVLGLGGSWQNLAMVRGWEAINGYNPLRIGTYDNLVSPGEENWNISHRRFPSSFRVTTRRSHKPSA